MLPGFRFLFTAIVLSLSVLVFGLGAAALLRAAHEEFASNPSWHAAPETKLAQPTEAIRPMLTMLRVEPMATEQKASDDVAATAAPAEPSAIAPPPAEPEQLAALKPEQTSPSQLATPAVPSSPAPESEASGAPSETSESAEQAKLATSEPLLPPASEVAPAAFEQVSPPGSPVTDPNPTSIAALGGPPVSIEASSPAKAVSETLDAAAIKKREEARRAAHRRKIAAARARQAQLAIQQQAADPFGQQLLQPVAAAARRH